MRTTMDDVLGENFSTPEKGMEFFLAWQRAHVHDYDDIVREMSFWREAFKMAVENRKLKHAKKELKKINKSLRKENDRLSENKGGGE